MCAGIQGSAGLAVLSPGFTARGQSRNSASNPGLTQTVAIRGCFVETF